MVLPPEVCTFLTFPGEVIPYSGIVAIAAVAATAARLIIASLPIQAHIAPILGAAFAGFEIHKHKGVALLIVYIVVSAAIVAEKIPVCTPAG